MADKRISELTALTGANVADDDAIAIVDTSATETKKIVFSELKTALDTATGFVRITGDTMTGDLDMSGADVTLGDNDKLILGAGSDLEIYHAGSGSFIADVGNGALNIRGTNLILSNGDGTKRFIDGNDGGAVEIHHADATNGIKLATTATGVDITGTLTSDGLTVDGVAKVLGTAGNTFIIADATETNGYQLKANTSASTDFGFLIENLAGKDLFKVDSTGDISFYEDTGTTPKFFWDASAESLGIGTTTLSRKLNIQGDQGIRLFNDAADSYLDIDHGTDGAIIKQSVSTKDILFRGGTASGELVFETSGSEAMRIDSSGNVNIGLNSGIPTGGTSITGFNTGPILSIGGTDTTLTTNEIAGSIAFITSDTSYTSTYSDGITGEIASVAETSVGGGYGLAFYTGVTTGSNRGERVRIDYAGNVGIGTSSPSHKLHVRNNTSGAISSVYIQNDSATSGATAELRLDPEGNNFHIRSYPDADSSNANRTDIGSTAGSSYITFSPSSSEKMRIDSSGNVGIGTSSPSQSLHVNSGGANYVAKFESTDSLALILAADNATTNTVAFGANGNNAVVLTGNTERMRIDSSGNLLVGTTGATLPESGTTSAHVGVSLDASNYVASARYQNIAGYFNRIGNDGDIVQFRKDGAPVGSIGVNGGTPYIAKTSGGIQIGNGGLNPVNASGVLTDGVYQLGASNARYTNLYLSGGVYLGGTGSANLLDDYEEGTWTPIIADSSSGGNTASSYTTNLGFYTKIGRQVTVHCTLTNINTTGMTSSNGVYVQGLPFSHSTTSGRNCTGAMRCDRVNVASDCFGVVALISAGSSTAQIFQNRDNLEDEILQVSALVSGQVDLFFTLTYEAS